MKLLRLSVIVLVAFAGVVRAQVTSPLQQRADEVAAQFWLKWQYVGYKGG